MQWFAFIHAMYIHGTNMKVKHIRYYYCYVHVTHVLCTVYSVLGRIQHSSSLAILGETNLSEISTKLQHIVRRFGQVRPA